MTTFEKLNAEDIQDIQAGAEQGLELLPLKPTENTPLEILVALEQYLSELCVEPKGNTEPNEPDEDAVNIEQLAFECGCLWGQQLVCELGWQWIRAEFNERAPEAVGVASPDASLVIYPFQMIFFYYQRILPIRIVRCFEILTQPGRVPMLPIGGLENVMDHID